MSPALVQSFAWWVADDPDPGNVSQNNNGYRARFVYWILEPPSPSAAMPADQLEQRLRNAFAIVRTGRRAGFVAVAEMIEAAVHRNDPDHIKRLKGVQSGVVEVSVARAGEPDDAHLRLLVWPDRDWYVVEYRFTESPPATVETDNGFRWNDPADPQRRYHAAAARAMLEQLAATLGYRAELV